MYMQQIRLYVVLMVQSWWTTQQDISVYIYQAYISLLIDCLNLIAHAYKWRKWCPKGSHSSRASLEHFVWAGELCDAVSYQNHNEFWGILRKEWKEAYPCRVYQLLFLKFWDIACCTYRVFQQFESLGLVIFNHNMLLGYAIHYSSSLAAQTGDSTLYIYDSFCVCNKVSKNLLTLMCVHVFPICEWRC